jgi:hypothetical protein
MRFSKRRYGEGLCPESVRQVALRIVVIEIFHIRSTKIIFQFLEKAPIWHNVIGGQSNEDAILGQVLGCDHKSPENIVKRTPNNAESTFDEGLGEFVVRDFGRSGNPNRTPTVCRPHGRQN